MGLNFLNSGSVSNYYYDISTIGRAKLKRVIDEAINKSDLDSVHPTLATKLKSVAETTNRVAAGTWKASLSEGTACGCPLTQAGVIAFGPHNFSEFDTDRRRITAANSFWQEFDAQLARDNTRVYNVVD